MDNDACLLPSLHWSSWASSYRARADPFVFDFQLAMQRIPCEPTDGVDVLPRLFQAYDFSQFQILNLWDPSTTQGYTHGAAFFISVYCVGDDPKLYAESYVSGTVVSHELPYIASVVDSRLYMQLERTRFTVSLQSDDAMHVHRLYVDGVLIDSRNVSNMTDPESNTTDHGDKNKCFGVGFTAQEYHQSATASFTNVAYIDQYREFSYIDQLFNNTDSVCIKQANGSIDCAHTILTRRLEDSETLNFTDPEPVLDDVKRRHIVDYEINVYGLPTWHTPQVHRHVFGFASLLGPLSNCVAQVGTYSSSLALGYYEIEKIPTSLRNESVVLEQCVDSVTGVLLSYALEVPQDSIRASPIVAIASHIAMSLQNSTWKESSATASEVVCARLIDRGSTLVDDWSCARDDIAVYIAQEESLVFRAVNWRIIAAESDAHRFMSIGMRALTCASRQLCGYRCGACRNVGMYSRLDVTRALVASLAKIAQESSFVVWTNANLLKSAFSMSAFLLHRQDDATFSAVAEVGAEAIVQEHINRVQLVDEMVAKHGEAATRNETANGMFERMVATMGKNLHFDGTDASGTAIYGCTDPHSSNFDENANIDNGMCQRGRRLATLAHNSPSVVQYNKEANFVNAPLVTHVRELTRVACSNVDEDGRMGAYARRQAAMSWGSLTEEQSKKACTDCKTMKPGSCLTWFKNHAGLNTQHHARLRRTRRRLRSHEYRKKVEESLLGYFDKACCKRPWGSTATDGPDVKCSRDYCSGVFHGIGLRRAAHTMRRMHQDNPDHPVVKDMTPDVRMALDYIAPEGHSVPGCEHFIIGLPRTSEVGAPSDAECAARSAIHHTAKFHGVSAKHIEDATQAAGINIGQIITAAASMAGYVNEGSGRDQSSFTIQPNDQTMEEKRKERRARWMRMSDEERAEETAKDAPPLTRRSQHEALRDAHRAHRRTHVEISQNVQSNPLDEIAAAVGLRRHSNKRQSRLAMAHAASLTSQAANWTLAASAFGSGLHKVARRGTLKRQLLLLGVHKHRTGRTVKPSDIAEHAYPTKHALSQLSPSNLQIMGGLIGTEPMSATARFSAIGKATSKILAAANGAASDIRKARRRQMSETSDTADLFESSAQHNREQERISSNRKAISTIYRRIGNGLKKRNGTRRRITAEDDGNDLQINNWSLRKTGGPLEFPKWYIRDYGWVSSVVHWPSVHRKLEQMALADHFKMKWWSDGAIGEIPENAHTGFQLIDSRIPPSTIGRALRRLAYSVQNKTPPWEATPGARRRLHRAIWSPSPLYDKRTSRQLLSDWSGEKPTWNGFARFIESREHRTRGRRLSEAASGLFNNAVAAPVVGSLGFFRKRAWKQTATNYAEGLLRYVIYDFFLCYLYPEDSHAATTQFNSDDGPSSMADGTQVLVHYSDRLCFPAGTFQSIICSLTFVSFSDMRVCAVWQSHFCFPTFLNFPFCLASATLTFSQHLTKISAEQEQFAPPWILWTKWDFRTLTNLHRSHLFFALAKQSTPSTTLCKVEPTRQRLLKQLVLCYVDSCRYNKFMCLPRVDKHATCAGSKR